MHTRLAIETNNLLMVDIFEFIVHSNSHVMAITMIFDNFENTLKNYDIVNIVNCYLVRLFLKSSETCVKLYFKNFTIKICMKKIIMALKI